MGLPGIESDYAVQSRTWVARAAGELGSGRLDGSLTRRGLLPHRDGNSGSRPPVATQKDLPSGWVFHRHQDMNTVQYTLTDPDKLETAVTKLRAYAKTALQKRRNHHTALGCRKVQCRSRTVLTRRSKH